MERTAMRSSAGTERQKIIRSSMQIEFRGHYYSTVLASDLQRDGMGLELSRDTRLIAEVFFSDKTGELIISLFEEGIPLTVIEQFIAEARTGLVPIRQS
jgi:hypothetical protein